MSDQGEPLSWRRTLRDQLADVFQRHGASVTVGLTLHGVEIQSADERVDVVEMDTIGPRRPVPVEDDSYHIVVMMKNSLNLKAMPSFHVQNADLVIGKNNIVLKDRYGEGGNVLSKQELAHIIANARDVVTL